jgi:imidazolonepropionase-like amidohydrolase
MGLDKDYGTLETGKKATLFVSKGPALDMKTNQVTTILVDGKFVSTSNFQEQLYLKYRQKYQTESKSE